MQMYTKYWGQFKKKELTSIYCNDLQYPIFSDQNHN